MKKLFVDINVILDVVLGRKPHLAYSQKILIHIEKKSVRGYVSAIFYPTLYYFIRKEISHKKAAVLIEGLLKLFHVVEVNKTILENSIHAGARDFEDGIQMVCAERCQADVIITRNTKDFKTTSIPVLSPEQYYQSIPQVRS